MTEERTSNVSSEQSSQSRQRRKRKWDQPAESLVSAGVAPLVGGTVGPLGGAAIPGALLTNPLGAIPVPLIQQHANAIAQMLNLPKIQDELIIAREIVINDAESSVRYKLTKRQTQEEIQRCTGAVVITRGKYHPPNAPPDGEKPLYLHISAGAHLKDTTERILSVDRAASMVEEMLKQHAVSSALPALSNGTKGTHAHSACVFLGFDPDPLLNIAARICGPSDQYINHIMNETGVNVILRGRGSGKIGNPHVEGPEQLHLFLSSNDSRSLENAKCLAENLLDTISIECGVSRVSSSKVYGSVAPPQQVYSAVPPPHQLVAGVPNSGANTEASTSSAAGLTTSTLTVSPITPAFSQGTVSGQSLVNSVGHTRPLLSGGTSYSGYGGIYPQATPLQQVALVLRQSASPASSVAAPTPLVPSNEPKLGVSSNSEEKRPPQKRKFQELPISSKSSAKSIQGSEFKRPADIPSELSVRNVSSMPVPKKFVAPTSNSMPPPPPPRTMVPPPPPPKFTSSSPVVKGQEKNNIVLGKVKSDVVSDTLVKLMEYGDDDDDPDENSNEAVGSSNSGSVAARKPFWAL